MDIYCTGGLYHHKKTLIHFGVLQYTMAIVLLIPYN